MCVPTNSPDCFTVGSIPANAANLAGEENRDMSPISLKIVAPSVEPMPDIVVIQVLKVMKEMTDEDMRKVIGNYNTLVTFSVRYALGRSTLAPGTMKRIIKDSLGALHEQTKQGILRDIEDYIEQHETVDALGEWQQTMKMLRDDLERKKKDG